jgi:serine O-acetyltransferase
MAIEKAPKHGGRETLAAIPDQAFLDFQQRHVRPAAAALLLAVLRKALHIVTGLGLHSGADIGAGMLIPHGSQVRVIEHSRIGVDSTLSQVCAIGAGVASGRPKIGDHVYIAPHACIIGAVTIGDGATIAA